MARRNLTALQLPTSSGISAAGTTQGTATALVSDITQVSTVGSGQGVILPSSEPGKIFRVVNKGANALLVYPPSGSQINALAANAGFSLAVDAAQEFFCATTTIWYTLVSAGGGTTTNALTMNNGGAGAASGTTFNGSAAQTISYNTIGAAPLASPTFTGTPAAPTASAGTNTTQLATTEFVTTATKRIPMTAQNTAYTLVAADAGKGIKHTDTTARTYTVNNSVFSADDVVTIGNYTSTGAITVASGAGFTMYLAGTTTTGSRTIAVRGVATIIFESASVGYISGPGVT